MAERFKAPVSTLREQARGFKPRQNQYLGLFFLNETQCTVNDGEMWIQRMSHVLS